MGNSSQKPSKFDWGTIRLIVYSLDDQFRFLVRSTFRKVSVAEVLTTSVASDVAQFMAQGPHVALVDLESDPIGGLAALTTIRSKDKKIPVLVAAGSERADFVLNARDHGIEGIVPKPISGHELLHRVSSAIDKPQRLAAVQRVVRPHVVLDVSRMHPEPVAALAPSVVALTPKVSPAHAAGNPMNGAAPRPIVHNQGGGGAIAGAVAGSGNVGLAAKPGGGGRYGDGDLPVAAAKSGGGTYGDDVGAAGPVPAPKASGTYGDDLPPPKVKSSVPLDAVTPPVDEEKRKREALAKAEKAAKAKAEWEETLAEAHHQKREGEDVIGFDVESVVAAHRKWLETKGAEGSRANLDGTDLAGVDLGGVVLASAGLRRTDLSDANLAETRLDGADLRYATLSAANCSSAGFGVAQLRHADLRLANLENASLRGADLSGARLGGAKLNGADFDGVTLVQTDLREADLSKVENLKQSQLDKATGDSTTRLPPGLRMRPVESVMN